MLALPCSVKAQDNIIPAVTDNWKMIFESPTHYEVSLRVIKCSPEAPAQLHVQLFNEGTGEQTLKFKLTVTNTATGENFTKEFSYAMPLGQLIQPSCEKNDHPFLRINLPAGWNLNKVQSTLTYIP